MNRAHYCVLAAVSLALSSAGAFASTAADWRFEEGTPGALIPAGDNTIPDSSGNGNYMRTYDPATTSPRYSSSVSPLPLRSGQPNTLSLDFGPDGGDGGLNDDIYATPTQPISPQTFTAFSAELAFNMHSIGGFQALFGKDGMPVPTTPVPPLKIVIRGDDYPNAIPNQIFVEWLDGNGVDRQLSSHVTTLAGVWYHVALTIGPTSAQLWVATDNGPNKANTAYKLVDSLSGVDMRGPADEVVHYDQLGYSVGRGYYSNHPADWSNANIDEVKISDSVLTPNQFEFLALGDANGDGVVNADDYALIDRGFAKHLTGFSNGDFNGDGVINALDYALIDNAFMSEQAATLSPELLAQRVSQFGDSYLGLISVPEPSLVGATLALLATAAARRRR